MSLARRARARRAAPMSEGFTRRGMIGASALALTVAATSASAAPETALAPRSRRRERLERWRFHLGHAADVEQDFGFGRDQRTFAKAGWGTADAAMAKFDDTTWAQVVVPHDWAVALPFAPPKSPPPKDRADSMAADGL